MVEIPGTHIETITEKRKERQGRSSVESRSFLCPGERLAELDRMIFVHFTERLPSHAIPSRPERMALSVEAETGTRPWPSFPRRRESRLLSPGFRVSQCSPGMTNCLEHPARRKRFVSEQRSEESRFHCQRTMSRSARHDILLTVIGIGS